MHEGDAPRMTSFGTPEIRFFFLVSKDPSTRMATTRAKAEVIPKSVRDREQRPTCRCHPATCAPGRRPARSSCRFDHMLRIANRMCGISGDDLASQQRVQKSCAQCRSES